MLVKSNILRKSAIDMNVRYSELLEFLESLSENPLLLLNNEYCCFSSETRLYSDNHKVNHRLAKNYIPISDSLYDPNSPINKQLLLEMIPLVGQAIAQKLRLYKKDHLPEGRYFAPDDEKTKEVLSSLHRKCFW